MVSGSLSNYLSEISLTSLAFFHSNKNANKVKNQLNKECVCNYTYKQEKTKYNDVVLYNVKAMQRIFPIEVNSERFEEDDLYYYKLLNTISGYVVYYFAFTSKLLNESEFNLFSDN